MHVRNSRSVIGLDVCFLPIYALYYAYMPRIARPSSQSTENMRRAVRGYLKQEGLSVNALAKNAGVEQSTLCRFLSGRTKSVTPIIRSVLSYAQIDDVVGITDNSNPLDNLRVRNALARVWDGSPEAAEMLARLIEAVGPLVTRQLSPHR